MGNNISKFYTYLPWPLFSLTLAFGKWSHRILDAKVESFRFDSPTGWLAVDFTYLMGNCTLFVFIWPGDIFIFARWIFASISVGRADICQRPPFPIPASHPALTNEAAFWHGIWRVTFRFWFWFGTSVWIRIRGRVTMSQQCRSCHRATNKPQKPIKPRKPQLVEGKRMRW